MPYVTDEVYNNLPIHEENIILSSYPVYNKNNVFNTEAEEFRDIIEFIKTFRNIKLENKIGKDFKIVINNNEDYSLILKLLRVEDLVVDSSNTKKYNVSYKNYDLDIYYEKEVTDEDIKLKNKQISDLEASIKRREALLSNENYCSKAPSNLVEKEKLTLQEEKDRLEKLKNE